MVTSHRKYQPVACRERKRFDDKINRQLHVLTQLDNYHAVIAILLDFSIIAIAVGFYFINPWLLVVSVIIIGSRQRALATILHESAHGTFARWHWWNVLSGTLLSGHLIFQTYYRYRKTHVRQHHGNLGDPTLDPDTKGYIEQGLFHPALTRRQFSNFIVQTCLLLKITASVKALWRDRLFPVASSALSREEKIEYMVFFVYWASLLAISWQLMIFKYLLLFWFLPYFTTFQVFGRLIEISEHFPLAAHSDRDIEVTRNRHYSGAIERFLTGAHGEQYHLTHHLRPTIPFWNIRRAHEIMMEDQEYYAINQFSAGMFSSPRREMPTILEEIWSSLPNEKQFRWQENQNR